MAGKADRRRQAGPGVGCAIGMRCRRHRKCDQNGDQHDLPKSPADNLATVVLCALDQRIRSHSVRHVGSFLELAVVHCPRSRDIGNDARSSAVGCLDFGRRLSCGPAERQAGRAAKLGRGAEECLSPSGCLLAGHDLARMLAARYGARRAIVRQRLVLRSHDCDK